MVDKRKRSVYDNKNCMLLYNYLLSFENEFNDFFEPPTGSEIRSSTGLSNAQQEYVFHRLVNLGIIEKLNPIHQQSDKDCPGIYRVMRIIKRL